MPTIVIIDDRVTNRDILAKLAGSLEEQTVVRTFSDPLVALDWLDDNIPDLVITDFKMPTLDGAEFTRRLRNKPLCADVPVIVVTVYEDRDFRYKALEAGATDFLLSPLDHYEFRTRASNLLTLRRQQQIIKKRAAVLEHKLITTDHQRKEEQRENEEMLRLVTSSVPAMICVTDLQGRCVLVNDFQAAFFGSTPQESEDRPVAEVFGADYAARHLKLDRKIFKTGKMIAGSEETFTNRDKENRTFLTTKAPLYDSSGEVANVVTVSVDITERKLSEEALQEAKEAAEASSRTKTEFLASMSHELRTPLNAVIGFADIMKVQMLGPIGNPKYLEYAEDIRVSAEHLLHIINDMLDVSTIEAGQSELVESDVEVKDLVGDMIRLIRGRADAGGVTIEQEGLGDLPLLYADERRVKQILINILSNAVKFSKPGGEVRIVGSLGEDGGIRLLVRDQGIGMAEEDIPVAIARFGRIEVPANSKHSGTGLGLPLAIELTRLHAGTLDIESEAGEGTNVTIQFPPARSRERTSRTDQVGE